MQICILYRWAILSNLPASFCMTRVFLLGRPVFFLAMCSINILHFQGQIGFYSVYHASCSRRRWWRANSFGLAPNAA